MNISLGTLKVSMMGVVMPAMVPIILPRPRLMSIRKNMTDQNGEAGKCVMASVNAMKARPVPCTDWGWGGRRWGLSGGRAPLGASCFLLFALGALGITVPSFPVIPAHHLNSLVSGQWVSNLSGHQNTPQGVKH